VAAASWSADVLPKDDPADRLALDQQQQQQQ
jgi:hypothetical protein